jgi:hypothetical protein
MIVYRKMGGLGWDVYNYRAAFMWDQAMDERCIMFHLHRACMKNEKNHESVRERLISNNPMVSTRSQKCQT